jgi:tRNA/rRNA methyltransferase
VGAFSLIEAAQQYDTVAAACADEQVLVGTTSFRGRLARTSVKPIREVAPHLLTLAGTQRLAFLFGPERSGLTEEELALCHHLITVPTDPRFATLNLAQAVLIVAYELFVSGSVSPGLPVRNQASQEEREGMYAHLERTLLRIGFLSRSNPGHIMRSLRRIYSKAELTQRDVRILRGILSQMEWYVDEGKDLPPDRIEKP